MTAFRRACEIRPNARFCGRDRDLTGPRTVHSHARSTIWDQVLGRIEAKVGRHSFHTWFKPTSLLLDDGSRVAVQVPNPLFTEWLPKHYSVVLAEALKDVGRPNTELIFVPQETPPARAGRAGAAGRQRWQTASRPAHPVRPSASIPATRSTRFIVGPSNQFAHAACRAVAEAPVTLVQPAVHLRRRRAWQDASDACHRTLRVPASSAAEAHLHLVRALHERDDQRRALRPHSRFPRALSHGRRAAGRRHPVRLRARKARRTSSSTRSMRCTTRRSRSSSAAIGRRTTFPRSKSACDRASNGA